MFEYILYSYIYIYIYDIYMYVCLSDMRQSA